jgi:hypothetical protein
MTVPDPNAKAPRPAHVSSDDERKPDMDHAPAATPGDKASFDRGTAEADRIARTGTLSGSDDTDQQRSGADHAAEARAGVADDTAKSRNPGGGGPAGQGGARSEGGDGSQGDSEAGKRSPGGST